MLVGQAAGCRVWVGTGVTLKQTQYWDSGLCGWCHRIQIPARLRSSAILMISHLFIYSFNKHQLKVPPVVPGWNSGSTQMDGCLLS